MRRTSCIQRRGTNWHFRRRVPPRIVPCLGQREVTMSLGTHDHRTATTRAMAVWVRTEEVFTAVLSGSLDVDQAKLLLRHMAASFPWEGGALDAVARRAASGDETDVLRVLEHGKPDILAMDQHEQAKVMLHLRAWLSMLEDKDRLPRSVGHEGVDALSQGVGPCKDCPT